MKKFLFLGLTFLFALSCEYEKKGGDLNVLNVIKSKVKIGEIKGSTIELTVNKEWLKSDMFILIKQMEKIANKFSDTLIVKEVSIVKDESGYVLMGDGMRGIEQSVVIGIDLEVQGNNLVISTAKPVEGCLGNHCSQCKLTKGKGCSCNQQGNCDHIIVDIPFLL